ncbi:MAG: glutathionylspermidine synthase family protein [Planctomycetes bacterium]|nr:glutathionylspermidine synthase family protein [Planctomycetota bacterium]
MSSFASFALALQQDTPLGDPWLDGQPRLAAEPVWLRPETFAALTAAAAGIAEAHDELARLVVAEPGLGERLCWTPWQRGMWQCSAPDWHGIARADVFWTASGPRVCELNSDTPSGEAEAVLLGARAAAAAGDAAHDPNRTLAMRFVAMVQAQARRCGHHGPLRVGLVYPTEMVEDLSMVALYRRWLEERGHAVVLGSPFNLQRSACGRVRLFDVPCDVIVRHYKTDWWGERLPVRDDEPPVADPAPLQAPLLALLEASVERRTAVVNPFGAVLTQNKRAMALLWELVDRLSPRAAHAVRTFLPFTTRLEDVSEQVRNDRAHWVLKSDYGCEGDEVVLGPHVDQATWEDALAHAIPHRWIAQRWFDSEPAADGCVQNHGVYLVGGEPAGLLLRRHAPGTTDGNAVIAPVLLEGRPTEATA